MAKRTTKRSAVSGQFVTKAEADANPDTTVRERRRQWRRELGALADTMSQRQGAAEDPEAREAWGEAEKAIRELIEKRK